MPMRQGRRFFARRGAPSLAQSGPWLRHSDACARRGEYRGPAFRLAPAWVGMPRPDLKGGKFQPASTKPAAAESQISPVTVQMEGHF